MRRTPSTPDKVETSIGTLQYKDGAPSKETVAKVYDYLDLMHGVEAFVNAYQGASVASIFKGFKDAGVPDNTALIWSELMDAKSLFLTANADTVYFWVNLDVTQGPLVVETPPMSLGVIDDIWFRWVTDFGLPGPDRGEGGQVPAGAARLQRRTAGERLLREQAAHDPGDDVGPVVPGEQRPQACGGTDQEDAQGLPVSSRAATARASARHWRAKPRCGAPRTTNWTGPSCDRRSR